jgi:SAM-dependent methyltransferase
MLGCSAPREGSAGIVEGGCGRAPKRATIVEPHQRNRLAWDETSDEYQSLHAEQLERAPEAWGVWSLPESELRILGDVANRDVLEYGCGAAQWSRALARRGARVTALDNSARQLEHASAAIARAGVAVRLVHASAETTSFPGASFDVVFCDHGAMSFAAPERTIPEAARILRRGGLLAFSVEHPMHASAWDDASGALSRTLGRPYFALDGVEDSADGSIAFPRAISNYVALLSAHGFAVEKLLEPQPPASASTTYTGFAPLEWARDFPAELIVAARLVDRKPPSDG